MLVSGAYTYDANGNTFKRRRKLLSRASHLAPVCPAFGRTLHNRSPDKSNGFFQPVYLRMTTPQIKAEIRKVLDNVPESVLQDVLEFLNVLSQQPEEKVRLTKNLRQILTEDRELLERLAQ